MITCAQVAKAYGGKQILSDLSLTVRPGEWVTVFGRSGSGKTTIARLILGAEKPDSGSVDVDGVAVASLPPAALQLLRGRLGPVFQEPMLLDDSVLDNVILPLDIQSVPREKSESVASGLLARLGMQGKERFPVKQLSRGEQMLVGVARALAGKPMIVLADEPTASMDDLQAQSAITLLAEAHAAGMTVVFFTADPLLAQRLPGRMVQLQAGRIAEEAKRASVAQRSAVTKEIPSATPNPPAAQETPPEIVEPAEPHDVEPPVEPPAAPPVQADDEPAAKPSVHAVHHRKKAAPPAHPHVRKKPPHKGEHGGKIKITPIGS